MKDFRLQLDNPPTGIYLAGGTVSGTVIAVNNKEPKDYKAIRVRIVGTSNTHWSAQRRRYNKSLDASETYIRTYVDVWDRNRSIAPGGHLPVGTFHFPFCLQLGNGNLPASYNGTVGCINYRIEARVIHDGIFKCDSYCWAYITVGSIVNINCPDLLQPKALQICKKYSFLYCASGPINITATVQRTGFCILRDSIPVEVAVENRSNRKIRKIVVFILKFVRYIARGHRRFHYRYDSIPMTSVTSEPVKAHSSIVWRPPPIPVPDTPPTLINCNILQVNYFLCVACTVSGTITGSPVINIPLTFGNVALQNEVMVHTIPQFQPPQGAPPLANPQPPPNFPQ